MKQLALMQGQEIVKHYPLNKDSYTIGRSKENDLVFEHPKVSRNHARLYRENDHYVLQDLNSTNYVFVNGVRIKQKKLEPNDRIQISSDIQLLFLEEAEVMPEQDKGRTMMDIQRHFVHRDDLLRLKKVTQSVVLLNSLDAILMQILKEGISLTNAERGLIVLTDGKGQIQWKYATTYRIDRDKVEAGEADISQSILQDALDKRETVVRFSENHASSTPPSESMMSLKIYSAMCAPLLLHDRIIGLFYVDARQLMNNFTEVDQFLFDYLADHAAIAIFNAKRYADLQAETQRLRINLTELENTHQQLEERHQKLTDQIGNSASVPAAPRVGAKASPHPPTHTYCAGGVVLNAEGEVLLIKKEQNWSLPQGRIEIGEEPAVTAQRQIFEAAGISYLHLVQSLGSYQRDTQADQSRELQTTYMYLFSTEQKGLLSSHSSWLTPDEALIKLENTRDKNFFAEILIDIRQALETGPAPILPPTPSIAPEFPI